MLTPNGDRLINLICILGVRCVDINVRMNKIIVLGHLNDTNVIVKALRKTGRRAEVLPSSYSGRSEEPPMRTGFRCLLPIKLLKKL